MAAQEDGKKKALIRPDEGAYLPTLDIVHKAKAEGFGGRLTVIEWGLPPGVMIPPHTHSREDECSLVLEGELAFDVGGQMGIAPAGSYVLKPRGVPHAFCNTSTERVWIMDVHTPGGFEGFYDEYEQIARKLASGEIDEQAHRKARAQLGERYGVAWHDERIPEARARFGIGP